MSLVVSKRDRTHYEEIPPSGNYCGTAVKVGLFVLILMAAAVATTAFFLNWGMPYVVGFALGGAAIFVVFLGFCIDSAYSSCSSRSSDSTSGAQTLIEPKIESKKECEGKKTETKTTPTSAIGEKKTSTGSETGSSAQFKPKSKRSVRSITHVPITQSEFDEIQGVVEHIVRFFAKRMTPWANVADELEAVKWENYEIKETRLRLVLSTLMGMHLQIRNDTLTIDTALIFGKSNSDAYIPPKVAEVLGNTICNLASMRIGEKKDARIKLVFLASATRIDRLTPLFKHLHHTSGLIHLEIQKSEEDPGFDSLYLEHLFKVVEANELLCELSQVVVPVESKYAEGFQKMLDERFLKPHRGRV